MPSKVTWPEFAGIFLATWLITPPSGNLRRVRHIMRYRASSHSMRLDDRRGIDMSKEIFDHDEGNAGLEKVHCLCIAEAGLMSVQRHGAWAPVRTSGSPHRSAPDGNSAPAPCR